MADLELLRYPVGRFERLKAPLDRAARTALVDIVEATPARFRALVSGRTDAQLDTPYRPGGWTVRQVVHHVADSHMNAYLRMKWALTEEVPAVKTYDEARWAELGEAKTGPVDMSVALLEALHRRWVAFMRTLSDAAFQRAVQHPEWGRIDVSELLALYSWHCRHHEAHIKRGLGV
jgi:cephalosporin-C deacetylase-like acetyl esterase